MSPHPLQGSSPYETWVLTLRAWSQDPTLSLEQLPALADDTFTPDTYGRLMNHVLAAVQAVSNRWHEGLVRTMRDAVTPFDLARELVGLRATLSRRVQLATHPALPEGVRQVLTESLRRDVERYQADLESAVQRQSAGGRVDHRAAEKMLTVVRENSFLSVLRYDVDQTGRRLELQPLPESGHSGAGVASGGGRRRRVVPQPPTR